MRTFDLTPLYRSAIGFDRFANVLDEALRLDSQPGYPPYNIELVSDDEYRITMAVAGFSDDEIDIEVEGAALKVQGKQANDSTERKYLHQGIAARSFERSFQLADHVKVTGARLENGLLHVDLAREVPEALKPRKIQINASGNQGPALEGKVA